MHPCLTPLLVAKLSDWVVLNSGLHLFVNGRYDSQHEWTAANDVDHFLQSIPAQPYQKPLLNQQRR